MPRGSERHTLIPWERSLKIDFRWLFSGDFSEETFSTLPFKLEKIHSTEFIMRIFWYKINDYENNIKSNRLYNKSAYYFCFRSLHSIWFCVPPLGMENTQRFLDTQFDLLLRPVWLLVLFYKCGQCESPVWAAWSWTEPHAQNNNMSYDITRGTQLCRSKHGGQWGPAPQFCLCVDVQHNHEEMTTYYFFSWWLPPPPEQRLLFLQGGVSGWRLWAQSGEWISHKKKVFRQNIKMSKVEWDVKVAWILIRLLRSSLDWKEKN